MDVPAVQNGTPVKDPAIISIRACAGLQCQAFTGIRVAPDYVLTAAHAAVGKNVFMLDGENISKENVYIHPSFSPDQVHNSFDLALIRVSRKANKIIQIYGQEVSGEVSIRGYGCDEHGNFGDLRSGETVIVPRQILSQDILDLMGPVGEDEYTYVTVGNNKGAYSGMCRGDSGGPILKKIKNRRYLVGVNSFYDFDEAGMTNFSAHTRLFRVLDWIASFGIKVKSSAG